MSIRLLICRRTRCLLLRCCLVALLILLFPFSVTSSHAASLQIWPIEIALKPSGEVATVQINNVSQESVLVQAMATAWLPENEVGSSTQERTDDLLISPPVFELAGQSSQTLRLAIRKPAGDDVEQTFRLVVTELPKTAGLIPNSLSVAVSVNMPVFVASESVSPKPNWSVVNTDFDGLELIMSNDGNAHINIKRVKLLGQVDQQSMFESEEGGYVIAGDRKRWPLDLSTLKGPVIVKADSNIGPIEALVSLPDS